MDGNYPATVHKLLTYWYPSPSLLESLQKAKTNMNTTTTDSQQASVSSSSSTQLELLQAVSQLHKHNHLPDNELRPVHQLDYATSGVLCIARTNPAAAAATVIFEERTATKTYTAIVEGHMPDISEQPSSSQHHHHRHCPWPILSPSHIEECLHTAEDQYRRTRGKSETKHQADTFAGFQPVHAVFGKWISMIQQQQLQINQSNPQGTTNQPQSQQNKSSKKRKQPSLLSEEDWIDVWTRVREVAPSKELFGQSWKQFCQQTPYWKTHFEQAATRHNDILRRKLVEQREKGDNTKVGMSLSQALPIVCRVVEDEGKPHDQGSTSATTASSTISTSLYIYAPLAQVSNEFGMKVPALVLKDLTSNPMDSNASSSSPSLLSSLLEGGADLDYKPSLTKCTILSRAYYHGRPVTKVQLYPKTGRRHQLRVHLALLGHPILGDATYAASSINRATTNVETTTTTTMNQSAEENSWTTTVVGSEESTLGSLPRRMCLHAQSLELPLESTVLKNEEPSPWKIIAPDPFLVSETGELSISY
jgi:23S rRNA-/tRNA-specific pseudouridylate synthase